MFQVVAVADYDDADADAGDDVGFDILCPPLTMSVGTPIEDDTDDTELGNDAVADCRTVYFVFVGK